MNERSFDVLVAGMVFADVVFTDLPTPPERTHLMLGSKAAWVAPCVGPKDKTFDGDVHLSPGYSIGHLEQEPDLDESKTERRSYNRDFE